MLRIDNTELIQPILFYNYFGIVECRHTRQRHRGFLCLFSNVFRVIALYSENLPAKENYAS